MDCSRVDEQLFKGQLASNKIVQMVQHYPSSGGEENLIYGHVFFLEKITSIIHLTNNSSDFLPILGVNFYHLKKHLLFLRKMLTAQP